MLLLGISIPKILIGILCVSLAIVVIIIAYRKLLGYLGKGGIAPKDYFVLYSVENNPAQGEVEIYFTTEFEKKVTIELLNEDLTVNRVLKELDAKNGGYIVRFQSEELPNGNYFYCLKSDNQKTMKRLTIQN
ncbi:MAG: hypothetical protein ACK5FX_00705 [Flavobacteriia bacterium]|jgi:hypothetical protein